MFVVWVAETTSLEPIMEHDDGRSLAKAQRPLRIFAETSTGLCLIFFSDLAIFASLREAFAGASSSDIRRGGFGLPVGEAKFDPFLAVPTVDLSGEVQ